MAKVKPIPDGYPQVSPYLSIDGASTAIDFYSDIFGAKERMRMDGPDGKIGHAELQIGDSVVMLADEFPDMGVLGPKRVGGTPVTLHVYVEDIDATHKAALDAGATEVRAPENQFYGDRDGFIIDPFGHGWTIASHVEDVAPEEMIRRMAQMQEADPS